MMTDTTNYDLWLDNKRKQRLLRMAEALKHDVMLHETMTLEMRKEAICRIERWVRDGNMVSG